MTEYKDSGTRRGFGTGAVRDAAENKGRFDLLPFDALQELAKVFEKGASKYSPRNWEKGIGVEVFLDSAARHLHKAISGHTDEPHLPMAMWNIACAIQTAVWIERGERDARLTYAHPIALHGMTTKSLSQVDSLQSPEVLDVDADDWGRIVAEAAQAEHGS